jgi:hypothetical protein
VGCCGSVLIVLMLLFNMVETGGGRVEAWWDSTRVRRVLSQRQEDTSPHKSGNYRYLSHIHILEDAVCDGKMKLVLGAQWYQSHIHLSEGLA